MQWSSRQPRQHLCFWPKLKGKVHFSEHMPFSRPKVTAGLLPMWSIWSVNSWKCEVLLFVTEGPEQIKKGLCLWSHAARHYLFLFRSRHHFSCFLLCAWILDTFIFPTTNLGKVASTLYYPQYWFYFYRKYPVVSQSSCHCSCLFI